MKLQYNNSVVVEYSFCWLTLGQTGHLCRELWLIFLHLCVCVWEHQRERRGERETFRVPVSPHLLTISTSALTVCWDARGSIMRFRSNQNGKKCSF